MDRPDVAALSQTLQLDPVRLELLAERHLEPLRAACAEDQEIWDIYPCLLYTSPSPRDS